MSDSFIPQELPAPATDRTLCGQMEWQRDNPFNRGAHHCRLPIGHAGSHRCGADNGTADGCTFSWPRSAEHKHECQHGHPHEGRCECVCGYEALSASKVGGSENWHPAAPAIPREGAQGECINCGHPESSHVPFPVCGDLGFYGCVANDCICKFFIQPRSSLPGAPSDTLTAEDAATIIKLIESYRGRYAPPMEFAQSLEIRCRRIASGGEKQ